MIQEKWNIGTINSLLKSVQSSLDTEEKICELLKGVIRLSGFQNGLILFHEDSEIYVCEQDENDSTCLNKRIPISFAELAYHEFAFQRIPIIKSNIYLNRYGLDTFARSAILLPMTTSEEGLGLIVLFSDDCINPSIGELKLISELVNLISLSIQNSRILFGTSISKLKGLEQ